ncbi:MAG TPA: hypothetical protein VMO17_07625 [Terriglobia bacterium]|nr:hypothetical protein [Terriglobia bacterium]
MDHIPLVAWIIVMAAALGLNIWFYYYHHEWIVVDSLAIAVGLALYAVRKIRS